jgi:hypothetical protein
MWVQVSGEGLKDVKFSGIPMVKQPDGSWTLTLEAK